MKASVKEMELMTIKNEIRKFRREVNVVRKPFSSKTSLIKDETGNIISEEKGICERWCSYFDSLLNPRITIPENPI